ncbi:FGGY-family carbohydrate kinase [Shimia abyssi]|uniref:Sugar (Pentulose or hexulose) kinase n=1 Tax=Shimia abyssi TaxID=1662395 RepID=A0A2P8FB63_9RHOB|nr:FGGY-family carbohydrate kinase [Shimia abyssi]PSL18892.1 sugar (pentulose or hexulose) kinase [Shimia abyssi]
MTHPVATRNNIAVIDVGKTNAKLALVDGLSMTEIAVVTRPNDVRSTPPYPHFDLQGHWAFFLRNLKVFHAEYGVDAISVTTHGASIVLLQEDGSLATAMLDYEHDGPDSLVAEYDRLRPDFAETGSPRLAGGLNVGAQLHWLFENDPTLMARTKHIITYPQYWGYQLTGKLACDVTSLGCHTDLWNPWEGRPSSLVSRLGISEKLAPAQSASDVLGWLKPDICEVTGMQPGTPVACGIHDSNASLVPHLNQNVGAFSVVSTGTWVVCMAVGGTSRQLDSDRDTLVNVNAYGTPVPSARFMGGREYEVMRAGAEVTPTSGDRATVLANEIMLLPSVVTSSGPFSGRDMRWNGPPASDGQRIYALSLYLAMMTDVCLRLAGGKGKTIIEGPFAQNADYLDMLAEIRPDGIAIASSRTGTSVGAAMLLTEAKAPDVAGARVHSPRGELASYARRWRNLVDTTT